MKEIIKQQIAKEIDYLFIEGDNEQDRSWVEGKIAGMQWVLAQLNEGEGKSVPNGGDCGTLNTTTRDRGRE